MPHVSGKLCGAYAGADLHVSCSPHAGMRESCERRETLFCVVAFVLSVCGLPLTEPTPEASSSVAREYMRPEARHERQGPRSGPAGIGLDGMPASGSLAGVTDEEPGKKRCSFFLRFGGELLQKRGNIRCPPRRCARAEFDGFRIPTALAARPPRAAADGNEREYLRQAKQSITGYILHGCSPFWLGSAQHIMAFSVPSDLRFPHTVEYIQYCPVRYMLCSKKIHNTT